MTNECSGCGTPTDHTVFTSDARQSICADCEHDSMFECPDCLGKFWIMDGYRMTSREVVCGSCAAWRPAQVQGRMRELTRTVQRDDYEQSRR